MRILLLSRKVWFQSLRIKFTGASFYNPATKIIEQELFSEDGLVSPPGAFDKEVKLDKGFVFPAFRDGHAHPIFAGREALGPVVTEATSIAKVQEVLRTYRIANPDQVWIEGGAYDRSIVEGGVFLASWLDEAVSDVPVVLHASDHHTIWVNSKALELVPSPLPRLISGSIDVDALGVPTGVLREPQAMALVLDKAPPRTIEQEVAALAWADQVLAKQGIVQAQDAWITPGMTEIYLAAVCQRVLFLDYNLAFKIEPHDWVRSIEFARADREKVFSISNVQLTANTCKFFADGVFGSGTASVLEPYLDDAQNHGEPLWSKTKLEAACLAAAELGFQLHIHAIGDAGVRQALDAIEHVQQRLGRPELPNVIAHAELISDDDIARFAKLNVVANMQPLWAQADGMLMSCVPRLGMSRIDQMYRMRDLIDSGATIAFGSDWPVSSSNPLLGIATAVTRQTAEAKPEGGWVIEQAVTAAEAFNSYSSSVSFQLTGITSVPLGIGQPCDFVVLSQNPLEVDSENLRKIHVIETFKAGQRIARNQQL
jgi:predicted amidohydrolase YtcJ